MIQLATDPNSSRAGFRPAASDKPGSSAPKRLRGGHAWPFLSRPVNQPAAREVDKPADGSRSSGS